MKDKGTASSKDLSTDEAEATESDVSFFRLFRFADVTDYLMILVGSIAAAANGVAIPIFAILWGDVTNEIAGSDPVKAVLPILYQFIYLAAGAFACSWLMMACWMIAGQRQGIKCRKFYLHALLRQEIGWFDKVKASELATRVSEESNQLQKAIGEKVATFIMTISTTLTGFIIAFAKGWKLALVVTCSIPVLGLGSFLFTYVLQNINKFNTENYAEAGGKAEEVFGSIKTVKALCGEEHESRQYSHHIKEATRRSIKYGMLAGVAMGFMMCTIFMSYSLGFWYGGKLVQEKSINDNFGGPYKGGDVLVIFFSIVMGGMSIGQASPCLKVFAEGKVAIKKICSVIDRQTLEIEPENTIRLPEMRGQFELKAVDFAYPTRPEVPILKGISIRIQENKRNAIVGESGSGKSTIMQLLLRFYQPCAGQVLLAGKKLTQYQIKWLRQNLGYVGQEPVLFATTIRENIKYGKHDATDEQIWQALRQAEAEDFVKTLEKGLDTYIGVGGGQFSGGQKQRIAIARALIKNPRVLLLDQATSALDRKNQRLIQATLDRVSFGRTTVTIAHRLATVKSSDNIIVMNRGNVVEVGNFDSLMAKQGYFYALARNQMQQEEEVGQQKEEQTSRRKMTAQEEEKDEEQKKADQQKAKDSLVQRYQGVIFSRLFSYHSKEIVIVVLSFLSAMANGIIFPAFSLFLGQMIAELVSPAPSMARINNLALYFLLLSFGAFLVNFGQFSFFNVIGEKMTMRVRIELFQKLSKMPIPYFQDPQNAAGALSARLSEDCSKINKLTSTFLAMNVQNFSSLLTGIIIAMVWSWQLSLVAIGLMPLMIIAGVIQMKFIAGFSDDMSKAYKDSSAMIMEVVSGIRTVKSFAQEDRIKELYEEKMRDPYEVVVRKGNVTGVLFGFSQMVMFLVFGIIFYIGALFIGKNIIQNTVDQQGKVTEAAVEKMFVALFAIMFAAMGTGNNAQFMPDVAEGNLSASRIFQILDLEDQFQKEQREPKNYREITAASTDEENESNDSSLFLKLPGDFKADIEFKNVTFKYPARETEVYKNLSFKIQNMEKVALVGPSGCGKSTIIQLLMRYYQPTEGEILLNGKKLSDYELHQLRSIFGLVSQEPTLFAGTIQQNIRYNKYQASLDQIKIAAAQSNSTSFIEAGEEGYNREVGTKGGLLSGGQKQRIAIARAVLRKPLVYLFDEATSALDNQNEKIVQQALNKQIEHHTSITIAHRLQTIKHSDRILVFEEGRIVEEGKFDALMGRQGYFFRLYNAK